MNLLIHFLDIPGPFTFSLALIVPMGLPLHSLSFLGPFTSSLSPIILVGLLAIIPVILACWACFTIFSSHFLHIVGLLLLLGPLSKVDINTSQQSNSVSGNHNQFLNSLAPLGELLKAVFFLTNFKGFNPPSPSSKHRP